MARLGDYHVISWPWALLSLVERMERAIPRTICRMQYYIDPKWRRHHWKANYLTHPRRRLSSQFADEVAAAVEEK